jgi:hypothetical protein
LLNSPMSDAISVLFSSAVLARVCSSPSFICAD